MFRFSMWVGLHKRLLSEVLIGVPTSTRWRLRWFDGILGQAVEDLPPQDCDIDLAFSHAALLQLAAGLVDLNEIMLVGEARQVQFRIECEDSTFWKISHDGEHGEIVEGWFRAFLNTPKEDFH